MKIIINEAIINNINENNGIIISIMASIMAIIIMKYQRIINNNQ
jgi:hypothetical protein